MSAAEIHPLIGRRLVANLDAEEHWSRLVPQPSPRPSRPSLARAASEAAAGFGTLMRVLAEPGDRLHTLAAVDPRRLVPVDGVADVKLETGPVEGLDASSLPVMPWAWAPPWAAGPEGRICPDPAVVARVNDRRFGLDLARELGVADPLARTVADPNELGAHLRGPAKAVRRWILKAPFSAAGRSRYLHRPDAEAQAGTNAASASTRPAIRRLFRQHGALVFEPWHRRVIDLGLLFEIPEGPDAPVRSSCRLHRSRVDAMGRFRGIELDPREPWLDDHQRQHLETMADGVARTLGEVGYRGPVGIDLWLHQPEGAEASPPRLHALGEINARLTFGWLAHSWSRALDSPSGTLLLGPMPEDLRKKEKSARARVLLQPDSEGRGGAFWVP